MLHRRPVQAPAVFRRRSQEFAMDRLRAPMPDILAILIAERDRLNRAIQALGGASPKRGGRPPKNAAERPALKRRRSGMSAAARKAQSRRMKAYWAAKRR